MSYHERGGVHEVAFMDAKGIPMGKVVKDWTAGVQCPYCSSKDHHALGTVYPGGFNGNFRQGCFLALALYCEPHPDHLFFLLVGEHKGSIWLETVISGGEVRNQ